MQIQIPSKVPGERQKLKRPRPVAERLIFLEISLNICLIKCHSQNLDQNLEFLHLACNRYDPRNKDKFFTDEDPEEDRENDRHQ